MSIRQQDDYELFLHVERSWQSIVETIAELERRGNTLILEVKSPVAINEGSVDPTLFHWRMERTQ